VNHDEHVQALRRRAEADPGDAEAAHAYEVALRRLGQVDPLRDLYRFRFLCDKRWEDLEETPWPLQRRCATCQRDVHLVTDPAQFAEHARAGHCVSVVDDRVDEHLAALADGTEPVTAVGGARPCVLRSRWQELLLALGEAIGRSPHTRSLNALGQPEFTPYEMQVRDVEQGLMVSSGHPGPFAVWQELGPLAAARRAAAARRQQEAEAREKGLLARVRRWLGGS
jgi:hypothetical protein